MHELLALTNHVALVTGASGALGSHFALLLAQAGAKVVVASRNLQELSRLVDEIHECAGEALAVPMDVTDDGSVEAAFDAAQREFGPVTVLVNNAGVVSHGAALDLTSADWQRVIDTNLTGAWRVAKVAGQHLVAAKVGGSIINIASILSYRVAGQVAPYAATKAALVHLTKTLALEWARHGIRVNALAPGYVETDLNREFFTTPAGAALIKRIPQRRLGQLGDLDGPLLLLASDASRYMTGSAIVVDGGHLQSTL